MKFNIRIQCFINSKTFLWVLPFLCLNSMALEQNVKLIFKKDFGNGYETVINPVYGRRVLGTDLGAEWAFEPGTTFEFAIDTDVQAGNLIFVIRETGSTAFIQDWVEPGQPEPTYTPPQVYWSHTINLSTASGVQTVEIPEISTSVLGDDPYKVFYFGIYSTGDLFTKVDAYFNDLQVGSIFGQPEEHHPELELPILYHHPEWAPDPAITGDQGSENFQRFEPGFDTFGTGAKPVFGALANYHYRLADSNGAIDKIVNRDWVLYELNGTQLNQIQVLPGIGGPTAPGGFLDLIPPEPPCVNSPCPPYCLDSKRYVALCRRYDDRGAVSTSELDLDNLGPDSFFYEVGHDFVGNVPIDLWVGYQWGNEVNDMELGPAGFDMSNPRPTWVQPYRTDLECWTATYPSTQYRVRVMLADLPATEELETSDWKDWQLAANKADVPNKFVAVDSRPNLPGIQHLGDAAGDESRYEIQVLWQIKTPFGVSAWTVEPSILKLTSQLEAPELMLNWPSASTAFEPGDSFTMGIQTESPVAGTYYTAKYSVWAYDPMDPNENHVRLNVKGPSTLECLALNMDDYQESSWEIPAELGWTLGDQSQLGFRVKCIWYPTLGAAPPCDGSVAQALNNFTAIATGGIPGAVAGFGTSPFYSTGVQEEGGVSLALLGEPVIQDPSGGVNFEFPTVVTGSSNPKKLLWLWQNGDGDIWRDGEWVDPGSSPAYSEVWPVSDPGDVFTQRWDILWQDQSIQPRYRNGNTAPPFALHNTENLFDNFFDGNDSVTVTVTVRVEFENGPPATDSITRDFTPTANNDLVTGLVMKADNKELDHFFGRVGDLPDLEWRVQTSSLQTGQLKVAVFKQNMGTPAGWDQTFCGVVDNLTNFFTSTSVGNGSDGKFYTLTAEDGCGLFDELDDAGRYQVRFSGEACSGGDWEGAHASDFSLNPSAGFAFRFHYRDHIGSSSVSRAYTSEHAARIVGAATFQLPLTAISNQVLTLYPQESKVANYTPFGKIFGNVAESEPNPRFTDHEFDPESGLNYMKGRFQLPAYGKFTRPDPMRDWDWEKPSTINLYQYVGNDPINKFDPTGMYQTDGHYWTIRYLALKAGYSPDQAKQIAKGAAFPDKWYSGLHPVLSLVYDWSWIAGKPTYAQRNYHALTGGNGLLATMNAVANIKNYEGSLFGLGKLFHTFGDSFAHRRVDGFDTYYWGVLSKLFVGPFGHLIFGLDRWGKEIDEPPNRKELYRHYVNLAFTLLKEKKGSDSDFDPSVIEGVLNTDNANKAGRIAILSAAIAVEEAKIDGTLNEPITVEVDEAGLQDAIDWAISQGYTVLVNGIPYDGKAK